MLKSKTNEFHVGIEASPWKYSVYECEREIERNKNNNRKISNIFRSSWKFGFCDCLKFYEKFIRFDPYENFKFS